MIMNTGLRLILTNILLCIGLFPAIAQLYPTGLRTDLLENTEMGFYDDGEIARIYSTKPSFSWIVPSDQNNVIQQGYRIILGEDKESVEAGKGSVWDSGWIRSNQSVSIIYDGEELSPSTTYWWSVAVETNAYGKSGFSLPKAFRTAAQPEEYSTSYYPLVSDWEKPEEIKTLPDGRQLADFGKVSFGQLYLTLDSDNDNDTIKVHIGERVENGRVWARPANSKSVIRYVVYTLPLNKGRHTYKIELTPDKRNTGPDAVKMPAYIGEVLPFRACEIEGYSKNLKKKDFIRRSVHYPFDDKKSEFKCSSDTLNQLWDLFKYTTKATSFLGIFVDGDRERIAYEYDALIAQLCHYGCESEYSLSRRTWEYLLEKPTWPTEWILYTILLAWNDYYYTGDARALAKHYEILKAHGLEALRKDNGLISTTLGQSDEFLKSINKKSAIRDIVDWPHTGILGLQKGQGGEDDGHVYKDYNSVVNALYYKCLVVLGEISAVLGAEAESKSYVAEAEKVKKIFNEQFFDSKTGLYVDGIGTDHSSLHSNMFPIYCDLIDAEKLPKVVEFIKSRGLRCSIFGSQVLMDALYDAEAGNYAYKLLTSDGLRSWYNTIKLGSTLAIEAWDNSFKPNLDWNHIAGAVPGNIIPLRLMGITPAAPGFAVANVKPQIGELKQAHLKLPTIRGEVIEDINVSENDYKMTLETPANMTSRVSLPTFGSKKLKVKIDGKDKVFKNKEGNQFVYIGEFESGKHEFIIKEIR